MSGLATWDKIIGPLGSTTTTFGGEWGNLISDYFNGIDIGLIDPSKLPKINTLTRYKTGKFGLFDTDESHEVVIYPEDIDTGPQREVRIRRMNSPNTNDYMVLENQIQTLKNKIIDVDDNTILDIANAHIKADAAIATSKLADSANFAMKNAANVFTQSQKISLSSTVSFTSYHATNVVANGTGFAFNLNNSTPAEITYAYIFGLITQNNAGTEQGSLAFYTRNGASLVDRMLLDHLNRLRVGITGSGIYIDPTGISGGSKIVTFPNENIKAVGEANITTITNKIMDVKKNTFLRIARTGHYYCASSEGVDADGQLYGLVGVGSQGTPTVNTAGKYHIWSTQGGVANDAAGVVKLDGFITRRRTNPLLRFAFLFVANTSSNRRVFKGWTAQRLLTVNSDTAPLNSDEHGVLFGHGSTDTNFHIFHNDAGGTCQKTSTGFAIPAINTNYIVELLFNDTAGNITWTIYSVVSPGERGTVQATGTISTRIPTTDIPLFMQDLVIATDTSIQPNNIHYIEVA